LTTSITENEVKILHRIALLKKGGASFISLLVVGEKSAREKKPSSFRVSREGWESQGQFLEKKKGSFRSQKGPFSLL